MIPVSNLLRKIREQLCEDPDQFDIDDLYIDTDFMYERICEIKELKEKPNPRNSARKYLSHLYISNSFKFLGYGSDNEYYSIGDTHILFKEFEKLTETIDRECKVRDSLTEMQESEETRYWSGRVDIRKWEHQLSIEGPVPTGFGKDPEDYDIYNVYKDSETRELGVVWLRDGMRVTEHQNLIKSISIPKLYSTLKIIKRDNCKPPDNDQLYYEMKLLGLIPKVW